MTPEGFWMSSWDTVGQFMMPESCRTAPSIMSSPTPHQVSASLGVGGYFCLLQPICLMMPFRQPVRNHLQACFNCYLSKARCVVERYLGILKTIFLKALEVEVINVPEVIVCCTVLHNICMSNGDLLVPDADVTMPALVLADELIGRGTWVTAFAWLCDQTQKVFLSFSCGHFHLSLRLSVSHRLCGGRLQVSIQVWLTVHLQSLCHLGVPNIERPIYVSFVSKAILWERGDYHYTVHDRPVHHHTLCPRYLSHMKVLPEKFHPHFLNSKSRKNGLSQGEMQRTHTLAAPKTQVFEGHLFFDRGRRRSDVRDGGLIKGRRSAVVPSLQLPPTPPPSSHDLTPPQLHTPHPYSGRQQNKLISTPTPASFLPPRPPPPQEKYKSPKREKVLQPALVEPDLELNLGPAGSACSLSPTSLSHGSFSDLSRPPSSLFSRSTDLSTGRSSVLSDDTAADVMDSDSGGSLCFPPQMQLPRVSHSPATTNHRSQENISTTPPPLNELLCGQLEAPSPHPTPGLHLNSGKTLSSRRTHTTENHNPDPSSDLCLNRSVPYDEDHATHMFPSTTWTSCPSPQKTTACSVSEAKRTPSPSLSRLEAHRWPVLPPISPVRGHSVASHCSELSCSQSHMFDELEAIAPLSTSCLSLDQASDSSCSPSPETELSPGLAALTMGCDSGNLGSLSRVQLLLLDRPVPETLLNPFGLEEVFSPVEDWSNILEQYDDSGDLRPLTAGSMSVRCDSAGKARGDKSDWSDGGSGSPSSWIIDPSPSFDMFRSSDSPSHSNYGSHSHDGAPIDEEPNYPGSRDHTPVSDEERRPQSCDLRAEGKERLMEEKKTKALRMLSKLQDNTPRQSKSSKRRSNFEDFDFLAKYCIFSQEKLAEYKRAFEAEDSDGDGYISCLQVLLALKTIIPPELLSDEEEIYVYRILEMVDFRVTDGLVDLRLFAVIASLAQKIASMDEFMRSLISNMDLRSLEVRLFKAKQLFLFLLEEQIEDTGPQQGFISSEQLLLELKAGGIHLEQEAAIRLELQHIPPLDLLDFLAYLPLFMLIHKSVISNPLDDSNHL